jgi:hypothetical protein
LRLLLLLLETGTAQHRSALSGLEGNRGFRAALRTSRSGFCARLALPAGTLRLALFAVPGIIFELFFVEEELFASSENKLGATVNALQDSI